MSVDGPIQQLYVTRDGTRLAAVLTAGFGSSDPTLSTIVVIDTGAATELGRPALQGVTQLTAGWSDDRIAVGTANGIAFIDETDGTVSETFDVGGAVKGLVGINNIQDDPIYARWTPRTARGSRWSSPRPATRPRTHLDQSFTLPGATAGRAYYDLASEMVHIEGSVADDRREHRRRHDLRHRAARQRGLRRRAAAVRADRDGRRRRTDVPAPDREQMLAFAPGGGVGDRRDRATTRSRGASRASSPGVADAGFLYMLARILFRRRSIAVLVGLFVPGRWDAFAQSRIGMNESTSGSFIVAAYTSSPALWLHPGLAGTGWRSGSGCPLIGVLPRPRARLEVGRPPMRSAGIGMLVLARRALGRLLLILGMIRLTTVLGYMAISVPAGPERRQLPVPRRSWSA